MTDYISRDDAIEAVVSWTVEDRPHEVMPTDLVDRIKALPSADAVSRKDTVTLNSPISIQTEMVAVVRCKDCKQRRVEGDCTHYYYCDFMGSMCGDNEYCSFGERREP